MNGMAAAMPLHKVGQSHVGYMTATGVRTIGLDNGIVIRGDLPTKDDDVPFTMELHTNQIEVAYWRKYWGLRNKIIDVLCRNYERDSRETQCDYEWRLNHHDVLDIIELVQQEMHKATFEEWENDSGCIWSWAESLPNNARNLAHLYWLVEWMQDNECEVIFYDSY